MMRRSEHFLDAFRYWSDQIALNVRQQNQRRGQSMCEPRFFIGMDMSAVEPLKAGVARAFDTGVVLEAGTVTELVSLARQGKEAEFRVVRQFASPAISSAVQT